jgi:hypothetical protein
LLLVLPLLLLLLLQIKEEPMDGEEAAAAAAGGAADSSSPGELAGVIGQLAGIEGGAEAHEVSSSSPPSADEGMNELRWC